MYAVVVIVVAPVMVAETGTNFPTDWSPKSPSVQENQWGPPDTSQTPGEGGDHVVPRRGDEGDVGGGAKWFNGSNQEIMDAQIPELNDTHAGIVK